MTQGKLYRSFIILQEDERGHSSASDKPLSGYAKIEVKNDKCKITFYVQNVKKDGNDCHMLLVCGKKDSKQLINLGVMNINDQGKSEVTCEYPVLDIGGLDISYEKICGAALCKQIDGKNVFLMAGFMTGEIPKDNWKLYKILKGKKYDGDTCKDSHKAKKSSNKSTLDIKENIKIKGSESEHNTKIEKELDIKISEEEILKYKKKREDDIVEADDTSNQVNYDQIRDVKNKFDDYEEEIETIRNQEDRFDDYQEKYNHEEEYTQEEEYKETREEEFQLRGNSGEFFSSIMEEFECSRVKFDDIKYCKWFKVPVVNLDVMCNSSNYNKYTTVYYPMINYYPYIQKYKHFMMGLKCDKYGKVKYLVYAIPGTKDKTEQPYLGKSGFVTWVQCCEKNKNMGYWLMFYDFKNSMVVVPMQ